MNRRFVAADVRRRISGVDPDVRLLTSAATVHCPNARSKTTEALHVLADGKLYAINQGGDGFVLQASPKFEVLATNSLGEATIASMAVSDGDLFVRTHKALWCFAIGTPTRN